MFAPSDSLACALEAPAVFRWLFEQCKIGEISQSHIRAIIRSGDVKVLRWFMEHFHSQCREIYELTIIWGNIVTLECVYDYDREHNYHLYSITACNHASYYGKFEMLTFLVEHGYFYDENACEVANGCRSNTSGVGYSCNRYSADHNIADCLRCKIQIYLCSKGVQYDEDEYDARCEVEYDEMVDELRYR